jgi:hypothetical protein
MLLVNEAEFLSWTRNADVERAARIAESGRALPVPITGKLV